MAPRTATADEEETAVVQDDRRTQILKAALDVLIERGFPDTRIADVAERSDVSPALVIYYFKTKDSLLVEAIRYSEDLWYAEGARRLSAIPTAAKRLEEVVAMTCLPQGDDDFAETWGVWLDLWATAVRHPEVRRVREEFDEHWRETIRSIVRQGQESGEFFAGIDADDFAVGATALLDGLAIQIALNDPIVDGQRAFELSMTLSAGLLEFEWTPPSKKGKRRRKA
jgi:AcrR family transcriptional regulator